jgi:hypothetical protein
LPFFSLRQLYFSSCSKEIQNHKGRIWIHHQSWSRIRASASLSTLLVFDWAKTEYWSQIGKYTSSSWWASLQKTNC